MKLTGEFMLIGLSKPKSATLTFLDGDREIFWAELDMTQDRFDALFDYSKDNWKDIKIAKCEFDELTKEGVPINCVVKEIYEK